MLVKKLRSPHSFFVMIAHCDLILLFFFPFGLWDLQVKRQRYQYRAKQERRHSTLTKERQELLEKLGFVWDSHASGWDERWKELRDFKLKHGHCRVPKTYSTNQQLAIWVKVSGTSLLILFCVVETWF